MMKKYAFVFLCFLFIKTHSQNNFNCTSHTKYEELLKTNSQFRINQELLEAETQTYIKNKASQKTSSATYIIPVVFHVIHTGGTGNISNIQIIDQIDILNKEFQRQQADTSLTPSPFKPFAAPFSVEFRLATIDPSGNCTNGIDRIYSTISACSVNEDDIKSISYWPNNKYLNIWLTESMHYSGQTGCSGGGYATFPGGTPTLDGINIRGDLIGSIGTAATNSGWGNFFGRYLIHELGHWFNLRHIWGDMSCGNDFVSDTPPAEQSNSGCPAFPYNSFNTCGSGADGEMFTNYMDYTNGPCLNMFTSGQVARMTAAINSSVSGRNNLWSPSNLIATGTGSPYTYPVNCVASPDILPYNTVVACAGDSVKFTDVSYGGGLTSRVWNFFGQPATSLTDSIVKVQYNTPGIFNIALTTNFPGSTKTTTFASKVYVLNNTINTNYSVPFTDSFENLTNFNNDWTSVNKNNDAAKWQSMSSTNYSGSKCIGISNYNNIAPAIDDLISPSYDLSALSTATLSFRLHFASQTIDDNDKLQIYSSSNCGKTWLLRYTRIATNTLKTVSTYYTTNHIPAASSSEWRQDAINLTNTWGSNPVKFKFTFTSGGGNNIFIDDININGQFIVTDLQNLHNENGISLFPNPSENEINILYELKNTSPLKIQITDVLGKQCINQTTEVTEKSIKLDTNFLSNGVYFIKMTQDNTIIYNNKFIKQNSN